MILVTGGFGFIGGAIVKKLNSMGRDDIIIVEDLTRITDNQNVFNLQYQDLIHFEDFDKITRSRQKIEKIYHLGACSDTTETDIKYLLDVNLEFSKKLTDLSIENKIPLRFASSASVYGDGSSGFEIDAKMSPKNYYALSKSLFDTWIKENIDQHDDVLGFRYFNVYGPGEDHKGRMSSVMLHFMRQNTENRVIKLFEDEHGGEPGEQLRDFVYVEDCVNYNLRLSPQNVQANLINVGSGVAVSYNRIAKEIINQMGFGTIEYIPFPKDLRGKYQSYTCAQLNINAKKLVTPTSLGDGIRNYITYFNEYHFR